MQRHIKKRSQSTSCAKSFGLPGHPDTAFLKEWSPAVCHGSLEASTFTKSLLMLGNPCSAPEVDETWGRGTGTSKSRI